MSRNITFREAINEALYSQMKKNKRIINFGVETNMFGSNYKLEKFGKSRFFICPLSEDMLTGFALGYAINGGFSVLNHARPDFLLNYRIHIFLNFFHILSLSISGLYLCLNAART